MFVCLTKWYLRYLDLWFISSEVNSKYRKIKTFDTFARLYIFLLKRKPAPFKIKYKWNSGAWIDATVEFFDENDFRLIEYIYQSEFAINWLTYIEK